MLNERHEAIINILKETRKEIAMMVALITVLIIMMFGINYVGQVIELIKELSVKAGLHSFMPFLLTLSFC